MQIEFQASGPALLSHTTRDMALGDEDLIDALRAGAAETAFRSGADQLTGGEGDDTLISGGEDDTLRGRGGRDILIGGHGTADRAVYSGKVADYVITVSDGVYTITDTRPGSPDGTDTVSGVELLIFADCPEGVPIAVLATATLEEDGEGEVALATAMIVKAGADSVSYDWAGFDVRVSEVVSFTTSGSDLILDASAGNGPFRGPLAGLANEAVAKDITEASALSDAGETPTRAPDTADQDASADPTKSIAVPALAPADVVSTPLPAPTIPLGEAIAETFPPLGSGSVSEAVTITASVPVDLSLPGMEPLVVSTNDVSAAPVDPSLAGEESLAPLIVSVSDVSDGAINPVETIALDTTADADGDLSVAIASSVITDAEDLSVSYAVSGLDADATAQVTFTSAGGGAVTQTVAGDGQFTVDLSSLGDGLGTATIVASDEAGNTATGAADTAVLETTAGVNGELALPLVSPSGGDAGAIPSTISSSAADTTSEVTGTVASNDAPTEAMADDSQPNDELSAPEPTVATTLASNDAPGPAMASLSSPEEGGADSGVNGLPAITWFANDTFFFRDVIDANDSIGQTQTGLTGTGRDALSSWSDAMPAGYDSDTFVFAFQPGESDASFSAIFDDSYDMVAPEQAAGLPALIDGVFADTVADTILFAAALPGQHEAHSEFHIL